MLIGLARQFNSLLVSRIGLKAGCLLGLTFTMLLLAAGAVHDATAENETRTLSFHHTHSGEDLTVTFKRNGRYDEAALKKLNHFLRDWRTQDEIVMDPHLFDILWEVYRDVDAKAPIQVISAYRSPATNAMLRRRSAHTGVARFSQHMLGHAMDIFIPGVPLEQIRFAGLRLQRGGVGFYPASGSPFVHLDTGGIRHWPRMTHDQLVKVFPNGRTVHIPSDGVPLKGYELAKADIEKRDHTDGLASFSKPNYLAALFKVRANDDEDEGAAIAAADENPVVTTAAKSNIVPVPRAKPHLAAALQLASADSQLIQAAPPEPAVATDSDARPQTPAEIIDARGLWDDHPGEAKQATLGQVLAAISARAALDAADPRSSRGVPQVYQAMAFAPSATAPASRDGRLVELARNLTLVGDNNAAPAQDDPHGQSGTVAVPARVATVATHDDIWMRIMLLAPSASTISVTPMGDPDLTLMRAFFVKPKSTITMGFSNDPMMGLTCDHFAGPATVRLPTTPFALHTALLH